MFLFSYMFKYIKFLSKFRKKFKYKNFFIRKIKKIYFLFYWLCFFYSSTYICVR